MLVVAVVALALVAGCSPERDMEDLFAVGDVDRVVVDALLIVGEPFPAIYLSRTLSPVEPVLPGDIGLPGATVTITSGSDRIDYVERGSGVYSPADTIPSNVEGGTLYELNIVTAQGERVRATTLTPELLTVDRWVLLDDTGTNEIRELDASGTLTDQISANQMVFSQGLIEAQFVRRNSPGYQVGIFSLSTDSDFVIDISFLEDDDLQDFDREISSPPLEALDGTLRLPWFAVFFEGPYRLRIFELDQNWFDLVRSTSDGDALGFGGNIGEGFDRPIFHVEGGIGLFGSAAVTDIGMTVLPPPAP